MEGFTRNAGQDTGYDITPGSKEILLLLKRELNKIVKTISQLGCDLVIDFAEVPK